MATGKTVVSIVLFPAELVAPRSFTSGAFASDVDTNPQGSELLSGSREIAATMNSS
jgi:hypothetical protein